MHQTLTRAHRVLAGCLGLVRSSCRAAAKSKAIIEQACSVEALESRRLLSTFHVSAGGSDSNSGTSTSAPWKTFDRVNRQDLNAGDKVLFEGGDTFRGRLTLTSEDGGSSSAPVTIGSYGSGKAIFSAGADRAIKVHNAGGVVIRDLRIIGAYGTNSNGINFINDLSGGRKLNHIRIDNVEISGFDRYGILITGENGASGFNDVRITNSSLHDNRDAGLRFSTVTNQGWVHTNVYIGHVKAFNNPGDGRSLTTGSGIEVSNVDGALIERCIAYNNGTNGDGGIGIWAHDANRVTIQYSESYNNCTDGVRDGGGFDFDADTSNSIMQYNYSHGNDGHGFQLNQWRDNGKFTNNIIRFNISENNGKKHDYAGIGVWGKVLNSQIYNNTIYMSPTGGTPFGLKVNNASGGLYVDNLQVRNNIITTSGGVRVLDVSPSQINSGKKLTFQGNLYWSYGSSFQIRWGSTFGSVDSFINASDQEIRNGARVGMQADPKLVARGQGGTIGDADDLDDLSAYKLQSSSPVVGKAVVLSTFAGIDEDQMTDFYGNRIGSGGNQEMGAAEWTSSSSSSSGSDSGSAPTSPPTPSGSLLTITTKIASYVRAGVYAGRNYNSDSKLVVKKSATSSNTRESYLRFDLSTLGNVSSANLRLYGRLSDTDNSSVRVNVYSSSNTNWSEEGLTWNNRPSSGSTLRGSATVSGTAWKWYEIDLTSLVKSAKSSGQRYITLVLKGSTSTESQAWFNSDGASSNRPELVVRT